MNPAEVTAWIEFRDPRPLAEWHTFTDEKLSRPWPEWGFKHGIVGMVDQVRLLLSALQARTEGQVWSVPNAEVFGGGRVYPYRRLVRRLMRKTAAPSTLAADLERDIETETGVQASLDHARAEMVDAVRSERLVAIGHRAKRDGISDPSAIAEIIEGTLFLGPRTIDWDGWIREDTGLPLDAWSGYRGLFFDRVHFRTADVVALWPATVSASGGADAEFVAATPPGSAKSTTAAKQKGRLVSRGKSPRDQLINALMQIHQDGIDIRDKNRKELHALALERAGIGARGRGTSSATFERALASVLDQISAR
jgi:hypothetical protein